jgi:ABC-type amino acid transport substrate-binding protein
MKKNKSVFFSVNRIGKFQSQISFFSVQEKGTIFAAFNKFLGCFFIFILLHSFGPLKTPPAYGANQAVEPGKPALRVGVFQYFPIVFEKNGVPTGFHLELLKEVAQEEGWTLEFQFVGSFKNVLNGLQSKTLDLGMGVVPTEARCKLHHYLNKDKEFFPEIV